MSNEILPAINSSSVPEINSKNEARNEQVIAPYGKQSTLIASMLNSEGSSSNRSIKEINSTNVRTS